MPDYIQSNPVNNRIINRWMSVDPSIVEGLENILLITREEYHSLTKFYLVDNGVLREMNQEEKDALLAEEAQAIIDAENARILNLDDKIDGINGITLVKIDTKIDEIGSLADAKVFLKKLCRYIIKFIAVSK